eukprot:TRINITY_DN5062_c0_g1_i1.p1 TRINITY_DN5062_c0_g1~~TRINITY_DN5062_c0_g1_i1.p1  ORF type:complete len:444 (+),score=169.41 TRINITY_DN5062_c0_g1_i1:142-1473(+)
MMAQADRITLNEKNFILTALKGDERIDGRRKFDYRALNFSFGDDPGHVEVQLGRTRVMTVVSCEVMEPYPDRPTEGFFAFNTQVSPMASAAFAGSGRQPEQALEVGRVIERALRESRAIDTEALCIVANEKVWSIRVDIHVLDHGGNIMDCASIATVTALLHFRRPDVSIVGDTVTVHSLDEREPVPLSIHHVPICVTFAFFDDGALEAVDPSLKEELIMSGRMTMSINSHNEMCAVQKGGGSPLSIDQILKCSRVASVKVAEITEIIHKFLKANPPNLAPKDRLRVAHLQAFGASSLLESSVTARNPVPEPRTDSENGAGGDGDGDGDVDEDGSSADALADMDAFAQQADAMFGGGGGSGGGGSSSAWDDDSARSSGKSKKRFDDAAAAEMDAVVSKMRGSDSSDSEEEDVVMMLDGGGKGNNTKESSAKKRRREQKNLKKK